MKDLLPVILLYVLFIGERMTIMKAKHLTLDDRKAIQEGIEKRLSKTAIAKSISKDPTTVAKEIKLHRTVKQRNRFNSPVICANLKECKKPRKFCSESCIDYLEQPCTMRDRSTGACSHCEKLSRCRLDHYFYNANKAHEAYLFHLSDSRQGVNLSEAERSIIAQTIAKPLKAGQSLYQILTNHPELGVSVKSLYTYIEGGVFKEFGIDNFSLRRQVAMRERKKLKKRREPVNYEGHKFTDYLAFIKDNPFIPTTEMDTVYNQQEGPYIQTFSYQNTCFMNGFIHTEKTSESMASTLNYLQKLLGNDYFKLFSLILTDRGTEFEKVSLFELEAETGKLRTNIFYCDPQTPSQKPHVENNHNYVRNILPNGRKLEGLTQHDLNLLFSHINSVPRKVLGGRTPYDVFSFFYGEEIIHKMGIRRIDPDEVTLQPFLLKIE